MSCENPNPRVPATTSSAFSSDEPMPVVPIDPPGAGDEPDFVDPPEDDTPPGVGDEYPESPHDV